MRGGTPGRPPGAEGPPLAPISPLARAHAEGVVKSRRKSHG